MTAQTAQPHPITRWLTRTGNGPFAVYAVVMAFTTYFAMYSFRKPFAAAHSRAPAAR